MVLEANPGAYVFPRLYLHAPKWWSETHPDDIVQLEDEDGSIRPFIHSQGLPAPSWSSETWRRDTVEGLHRLIDFIENGPYADHVIGYHIASGTTEEWMMWGANEREWVDYSPVNTAGFRKWLHTRYASLADLRNAWNDTEVTFDNARIPSRSQRTNADLGALRNPHSEQQVIDYYEYHSALVADTIRYFAAAVKGLTRRQKTVGVFYGYLLQLCGEQRQQNAGHLALHQVLESPDIDFLCSPTSYAFRKLGGEGTSHFMSLVDSVKLHDKLWFDENDIRTSLVKSPVGHWGRPETIAGDITQQEKELANVLTNGVAQWWFDVGRNRYDDPKLMARIGDLVKTADQTLDLNRERAHQVALVVDETSLCRLKTGHPLGRDLLVGWLPQLHRAGMPVGHYLSEDLSKLGFCKMLIFPTSFAPSAEHRAALNALKGNGRVLVFLYAPGVYGDTGMNSPQDIADFGGIRLQKAGKPVPLRVRLGEKPEVSLLVGQEYGTARETSPVFVADDPEAVVLGVLPDGSPGLVIRRYDTWTAVYSAAPLLPAPLIRTLAELAGVHRYIDTEDVVWAAKELLAVSVHQAGTRTVHLPERARVVDLYTGTEVSRDAASFTAEFADRQTRLFQLR